MIFSGTQCCCFAYQDDLCTETPVVVIVLDGNRAVMHLSNFKCEIESEFHLLSSSGFDLATDIEILCIQRMTMVGRCLRALDFLKRGVAYVKDALREHNTWQNDQTFTFRKLLVQFNSENAQISHEPT